MSIKILALFTFFLIVGAGSIVAQTQTQDLLNSARRLEYGKKYQEALAEINKAIGLEPNNRDLYLKRARLYHQLKNNASALADIQTAISFKPDDASFLAKCARLLNWNEQYDESLKIADRLFSFNTESAAFIGYQVRYQTRFLLKDYAGTVQDIIKTRDLSSAYYEGKTSYLDEAGTVSISDGLLTKTLFELKNDPDALSYYDELFRIVEEGIKGAHTMSSRMFLYYVSIDLYTGYALAYEMKHTPEETAALFEKYAKEFGLERRAAVYKKLARYEAALKDLAQVIETTRHKSSYLIERGDLYMLMRKFDKAIADYENAKKIDKNLVTVDEKIAAAREKINKTEKQLK